MRIVSERARNLFFELHFELFFALFEEFCEFAAQDFTDKGARKFVQEDHQAGDQVRVKAAFAVGEQRL